MNFSSQEALVDAIGYYNRVLAINASNPRALNNIGFALYSLGNYSGSLPVSDAGPWR